MKELATHQTHFKFMDIHHIRELALVASGPAKLTISMLTDLSCINKLYFLTSLSFLTFVFGYNGRKESFFMFNKIFATALSVMKLYNVYRGSF